MPITGPIPLPKNGMQAFLDSLREGAEARKSMAQANLPFAGNIPPGPAGQTVGLEMIKNLYGENSQQYKQAKAMYDLQQESTGARVNYQNILSGTAPKRFSTNLGKTTQELEDIQEGFLPGTRIPLSEEQKKHYKGLYGNALIKPTTDADTRKRNLFSKNIDITVNRIDPDALTQYSGLEGMSNLLKDRSESLNGKNIPRYQAYENALTNSKLLAKQVRQFYGDSITPSIQEDLKAITNPTSWLKSPQIALNKYNTFINTLKSEQKTYRQAMESPEVYSNNEDSQQSQYGQNPEESQNRNYSPDNLRNQPSAQQEGIANIDDGQINSHNNTNIKETVKVRNKRTGEIEVITKEEAKKRGIPGV